MANPAKPSTVVFDLSEVLLSGLLGTEHALAMRLGISSEQIDFRIPELQLLFEGKISEVSYWESLLRERGWPVDINTLKLMVRENFTEIEGTRKIIKDVRQAGYKVVLFSVHASEWIEFCEEKFRHGEMFELSIYSFEIGLCKPDRAAFDFLLAKVNMPAREILFIDDSERNIQSAGEMGIQTVLFRSANQLRFELVSLGMLF